MKIAITSNGTTLNDQVDARFGRCPYFIFVNPETLEFESITNPNMSLGGGRDLRRQLEAIEGRIGDLADNKIGNS